MKNNNMLELTIVSFDFRYEFFNFETIISFQIVSHIQNLELIFKEH